LLQALESELSDMGDDRLPRAPEYLILRRDLELDLSQGLEKLRSKAVGAPMMHAGAALAQEVRRRTDGVRWVLSLLDELGVQEQWTLCEWFEGMLTDILRDKAKHDLLASLAKGLQEIRERLLRSLPDVEGEQWLIASRVRRADLDRERGGYAAALAAYQGALQAARDLHGEDPQDPVALDDLGLIQSRIGVTLQGMGDRAGAVQALEDSLRLARELRSLEDSGFARNGVAVRCLKLGDVYRGLRQFEEARRCYEETQELMQRPELLPSQSKREALLASSIEALAGIEGDTGDRRRAITLFQNAVDLRRRILSRDPASRSSRSSLGGVLCRLADLHLQLRETEQARAHYEETLRLLGEGDEQDPEDLSARFQRGDVSIGLLKSCGAVDRDELRRMAEETMREIERLRSDLPTNVDVTRHAFDGYVHIGRALEGQGAPDAAVVAFGRAIEAADEFLRADPDGSTALRNLSVAYMSRGNCLARQDKWASARPDFERCLDLTKAALANRPSDRNLIRDLVGGYWMLGMACLETGEEERVEESIRSCGRALEDYLAAGFEPDKQLQEIQRRLREIL
jgi:tetratricopeptide (TPR) repeat protein